MTTAGESTFSSQSMEGEEPRYVDIKAPIITIAASSGSVLLVAGMSLLLTAILLNKFRTVQRQVASQHQYQRVSLHSQCQKSYTDVATQTIQKQIAINARPVQVDIKQEIWHCHEQGCSDSSQQSGEKMMVIEEETHENHRMLQKEHICIAGRDEEWLKKTQEAIVRLCPNLTKVSKITTQLLTSKPYKFGLLQRVFREALFRRATKVIFVALAEPRMILVKPVCDGESQLGGFFHVALEQKMDIFFILVEEPGYNERESAPKVIKEMCANQPELKELIDKKRFARLRNKRDFLHKEEDTESLRTWLRRPSKSV